MKTIKEQLDECWENFDAKEFMKNDPIQIIKTMQQKRPDSIGDIETCAILTALVSWGQRPQIIKTAQKLMDNCNWHPLEFIKLGDFYDMADDQQIYRTLKGSAFKKVCHQMRLFYNRHESIQKVLSKNQSASLDDLLNVLCKWGEPARLGSPERNSACKRINMLLRWMVRKDEIDLGLWQTSSITPASLYAIMDIHVTQQALRMGLVSYSKESWKSVIELTQAYRSWDAVDPLKYDFVLMTNDIAKWK